MNPYVVAFFIAAFALFVYFAVVRELVNRDARSLAVSRDRWVAWFVSGSVTVQGVTDLRRRQLDQICDEQAVQP